MSGKPSTIRLFRTWHRRIALALGLLIVFQGLTGAVSQYRFWLLGATDEFYSVTANGPQASPAEILAILDRELPGFATAHVMYPTSNAPDTAVMVMGGVDPAKRMESMVSLDQYQGSVIGSRPLRESGGVIGLASTFHKWTLFGTTGRIILTLVGVAASALALLGVMLWWRTRKAKPPSTLARLHRSAGLVVAAILLPVAITGTILNLITWYETAHDQFVTSANMRAAMAWEEQPTTSVDIDEAFQTAIAEVGPQRLAAFSPAGAHARHHWFAFTNSQLRRTDVLVNPQTGAIEGLYPDGLASGNSTIRSWLFPIHSLHVIGSIGGAIAAAIGLALGLWFLSGLLIWRGNRGRTASWKQEPQA